MIGRIGLLVGTLTSVCLLGNAQAITLGQIDNFQDGSTQGWGWGGASPGAPSNVPNGGPAGTGDNYLNVTSTGIGSAGSKMAVINGSQWQGDYVAAGVATVTASAINLGATELNLRFGVLGGTGTWFVSTTPIVVPVGSGWQNISFDISESAMSAVLGFETYANVFSTVFQARFLSNPFADYRGETIAAQLGLDNISAPGGAIDGDFNMDGVVDGRDFLIWQRGNSPQGISGGVDLGLWQANYGSPIVPAFDTIPEPSCVGLLLGTLALGLLSRRGRG